MRFNMAMLFDLNTGDVFLFTDDPEMKQYQVAGIYKYNGYGCGMGEQPGGRHIFCTSGHRIHIDDWKPDKIQRKIKIIKHHNGFEKYIHSII
jgi:hypothetical protein